MSSFSLRPDAILDAEQEARPPAVRIAYLESRLRQTVAHAYANAPRFRAAMDAAGLGPQDVQRIDDLARLPLTAKDELPALQAADPPFGGLAAVAARSLQRIFISPGNIFDPQGQGQDFWRFRPALAAAGFSTGDIVLNTFAYHLTPAGFMLDGALRALGCVVVPTGPGNTELQVRIASALGATGYVGTPSFLYAILGKAAEMRSPLRIEVAWVTAEMLPDSLRHELETAHGIRLLQGYGTADAGMLAYECPEKQGMHLHPEVIVEVLDLATREPVAPGQPGEVVATIFDEAYPLIRFATGDLSAFREDRPCPCGRTAPKLAGILGRVGDAVKVKGMFVRASQMEEVVKGFPQVARFQAVVTRSAHQDHLAYLVELAADAPAGDLADRLAEALREQLKVRGDVEIVSPGTIPAGAKRIDDRRVWK
ncbi:MAG TPA: AMP-binding protein [Thermoanaerobaculia bacterium]|nr:AMP-binding protein [Thermoanaerobaculia bacterium]